MMRAVIFALGLMILLGNAEAARGGSRRGSGGGHYRGGHGSSHKGGSYKRKSTNDHYRHRK